MSATPPTFTSNGRRSCDDHACSANAVPAGRHPRHRKCSPIQLLETVRARLLPKSARSLAAYCIRSLDSIKNRTLRFRNAAGSTRYRLQSLPVIQSHRRPACGEKRRHPRTVPTCLQLPHILKRCELRAHRRYKRRGATGRSTPSSSMMNRVPGSNRAGSTPTHSTPNIAAERVA